MWDLRESALKSVYSPTRNGLGVYVLHTVLIARVLNGARYVVCVEFALCTTPVGKDSNFTHANRIVDGDPMELVPAVHPKVGTLALMVSDGYDTAAVDVKIVLNKVRIAENIGGGLYVSIVPQLSQSYIQLWLKEIEVIHNFLVEDNFQVYGYVVRFEELMTSAGDVYTSLE